MVRALDAAQVVGDLAFLIAIFRLAEIVLQEEVFGRDRGVGLELEHPVAVRLLEGRQRIGGALDGAVEF